MSEDNLSNLRNEDSENYDNDEYKYYYENGSHNITNEEIDTFAHSRGREINETNTIILQNENNLNNNNSNIQRVVQDIQNFNNRMIHMNSNIRDQRHQSSLNNEHLFENTENQDLEIDDSDGNNNNRNFENQLDDLFDHMTYVISTEKQSLKVDKLNFEKEIQKFNKWKSIEILKLEKEKEQHSENLKIVNKMLVNDDDIIDLDIGGTHKVSTTRNTLTKYPKSALAVYFSGKYSVQKHNERVFIDRDGNSFMLLLYFLRSDKLPIFRNKNEEITFFEELDFWQISLNESEEKFIQFDPDWLANTLSLENNNTIVKKQNVNHGILFCKTTLDQNNNYIEFKVTMNVPSRGKSHLFIGLVDKTKYRYEHLTSTFWKDSPSSFYWDVWNTKLIKTDENGVQIGSFNGYGCLCEEYDTKIGMLYDFKRKCLSFIKNGINQGVAFRNVPSGLTPSLDIWFESGMVEILKKSQNDKICL